MSLINQMLQDLEKRRASASERGELPSQVRVLPHSESSVVWWWLGAAGAVFAALAAWHFAGPRVPAAQDAATIESSEKISEGPASRLALDLAKAPPAKTPAVARPVAAPPSRAAPAPAAVAAVPVATVTVIAANSAAAPAAATLAQPVVVPPAMVAPSATAAAPAPAANKSVAAVPATPAVPETKPVATAPPAATGRVVLPDNRTQTALANSQIDKRSQALTPQQLAENEYRDAATLLNQGRLAEAQDGFRQALQQFPGHTGARQSLAGLLLEAKKSGEAEQVLQEGLNYNPGQPGLARLLAGILVARGDNAGAIDVMQKSEASALNNPDYLAFLAGLLQRQSRHQEAVAHYQAALRIAPQSGVWLMGMGISLQALDRNADAQDAFRRARASNSLSPELQAFVDQRLRQLQ